MNRLNIHEAKSQLSAVLAKLKPGEKVLICRRNMPVAELCALPKAPSKRRPIGLEAGRLTVPESFFDPLPEEVISGFESGAR
jgi:antitoxin (DNA-binding transcriptional repressor) of toxin-antitoxin stability system